ncbi:MAG: V-type ATP synthase subunit F [Chromatiaceae bacterium]|jgi:vacuolar-type H+-ATPase subunit F/Vma7
MTMEQDLGRPTRMLFLGEETLADGFRLIGFETHASPAPDEIDRILRDLRRNREKAFVVVDDAVMRQEIPNLKRVRREGGRIVVVAVPSLSAPTVLASEVAERLATLFGTTALQSGPPGTPGERT